MSPLFDILTGQHKGQTADFFLNRLLVKKSRVDLEELRQDVEERGLKERRRRYALPSGTKKTHKVLTNIILMHPMILI